MSNGTSHQAAPGASRVGDGPAAGAAGQAEPDQGAADGEHQQVRARRERVEEAADGGDEREQAGG